MGYELLLGDSEKREVKIRSELGTFTKQLCSYCVALKEILFYIAFACDLVCVCYNLIINSAGFSPFQFWMFLVFQVRRLLFQLPCCL